MFRAMVTESRESNPTGIGSNNNYVLSTLSISSARVEHGGRYECRASNAHGNVAHAARLNVYGQYKNILITVSYCRDKGV